MLSVCHEHLEIELDVRRRVAIHADDPLQTVDGRRVVRLIVIEEVLGDELVDGIDVPLHPQLVVVAPDEVLRVHRSILCFALFLDLELLF